MSAEAFLVSVADPAQTRTRPYMPAAPGTAELIAAERLPQRVSR